MKEHVTTTATEEFELKYFKTLHQNATEVGEGFYGIYVAKCDNVCILEEADSGPISDDAALVCAIIERLAKNTVTPMTLYEVLDELEMLHQV